MLQVLVAFGGPLQTDWAGEKGGLLTGRHGRVQIAYDDAGIKAENRDAVKLVRDSGAFERFADRTSKVVALPHDIVVRISDDAPRIR